jgi:hypothetical protein
MKILSASAAVFIFSIAAFIPPSLTAPQNKVNTVNAKSNKDPKIQVAILLDVSGSMSGLIEQAKAQLWNMVSVMGRTKCENGNPRIEIALYIYGQGEKGMGGDYIKQVTAFSSDLDQLSQELFKLTTTGSEEYCGKVIYRTLDELTWDAAASNYKVIFIAGNESFLQGDIAYTTACDEAKKKGVIVNTIYCGDKMMGIKEHWNLNGECGNGSYTNINQNAGVSEIPTPYDSALFLLNNKLNGTYLYYGVEGYANFSKQAYVDQLNATMSKSVGLKRVKAKSSPVAYSNSGWDLVDAIRADSSFVRKVDMKTLPDSLKNKNREELQQIVNTRANERGLIQKEIATLNIQRDGYIAAEKTKATTNNNTPTLETEIEKIIKEQVKRFNMYIE